MLASEYLQKEQYEKIPEILGDSLDLKMLYPDRKVFHVNEFEGFNGMVCQYFAAIDDLHAAQARLELIENYVPDSPKLPQLQMLLMNRRFAEMTKRDEERRSRRESRPIGRGHDISIQTDEAPKLQHTELLILYQQDLAIPKDSLQGLLELPRETLLVDLSHILWDSVRRYAYFSEESEESGRWDEKRYTFPMHALFLLTELDAKDQLPLLLDCLRQGHDYLEFWYGDHIFETWWHFIYHLGQDQLDLLRAFMQEPDLHYHAKTVISQAVCQIGLHQRERLPEVLDWYQHILDYFLAHQEEELLIDLDAIAPIISDLAHLPRAKKLLSLIQTYYAQDLIDEMFVGTYDDLEQDILQPPQYDRKRTIFSHIFDHYQHIISTWGGYQSEDHKEALQTNVTELTPDRKSDRQSMTPPKPLTVQKVGRNNPCPCGSGRSTKMLLGEIVIQSLRAAMKDQVTLDNCG